MGTTYIISVFIHIVCAAFWLGGMLFLPLVLMPSIKQRPERIILLQKTGLKFRLYGWIALGGLLITGIYNMEVKGMSFSWEFLMESQYGQLLGHKLCLLTIMLIICGIHDFYIGGKAIEEMQQNENTNLKLLARWSGRINLLLTLIIAFLGVALSRGGF